MLWAMLQHQPIPSAIATRLWTAYFIDLDVICGSAQALEPAELVEALGDVGGTTYKQSFADLLAPSAVGSSVADATHYAVPDDDTVITEEEQILIWRRTVKHVIVDRRRLVLAALRAGFLDRSAGHGGGRGGIGGDHPIGYQLRTLTLAERSMVISGTETLTAAAVLSRLVPDYPGWTQRRRAPLERNYFLLTRVLKSDAYAPFLKDFLRFVTSSASFCGLDKAMQMHVVFDPDLDQAHLPRARTCFRQLVLSEKPYDSEQELRGKLVICAESARGFGAT